jgi:multicomponent Na+:H+ antiporter subunit D
MNLGGIPPFSGFLGKVGLFVAGADAANGTAATETLGTSVTGPDWLIWVVVAVGAATSLITLYALARFWNLAFWRPRGELEGYRSRLIDSVQEAPSGATVVETRTTPVMMLAATGSMVALTVALTVFAGPLFDLSGRAAENLRDASTYVSLVFPEGVPR